MVAVASFGTPKRAALSILGIDKKVKDGVYDHERGYSRCELGVGLGRERCKDLISMDC